MIDDKHTDETSTHKETYKAKHENKQKQRKIQNKIWKQDKTKKYTKQILKTRTNQEKYKAKYENKPNIENRTKKSGTNSHWRPAQGALHMLAAKKQHPWRVFDSSLRKEKRETMFFFYNFQ